MYVCIVYIDAIFNITILIFNNIYIYTYIYEELFSKTL